MASIFNENIEPEIPSFNTNEIWARKEINKIADEVHQEYYGNSNGSSGIDEDVYSSIIENSVGNQKIKKIVQKILLSAALVASLVVAGQGIATNVQIENVKEQYVEDISEHEEIEMHSSYLLHSYDFDGIGYEIANSIIENSINNEVDPNLEVVKGLGVIIDEVSEHEEYRIKDASFYAPKIYKSIQRELSESGIIELPQSLDEFLQKNNFGNKILIFNPITGMINYKDTDKCDEQQMIENMVSYAKYVSVQNEQTRGGR